MNRMLAQAALTGGFCVVFAVVVDAVTDRLALAVFLSVSFASGFCGSLFAQTVLRRGTASPPAARRRESD
jgi:hypothetical protein